MDVPRLINLEVVSKLFHKQPILTLTSATEEGPLSELLCSICIGVSQQAGDFLFTKILIVFELAIPVSWQLIT